MPRPITDIAGDASWLWRLFLQGREGNANSPADLLQPRPREGLPDRRSIGVALHPRLMDFGDRVVLQLHYRDWGTGLFSPRKRAEILPLLQPLSEVFPGVGTLPPAGTQPAAPAQPAGSPRPFGGFGAWLYIVMPGMYAVVYDQPTIRARCAELSKNEYEVRVKLFLHELSHLVQHRSVLFSGGFPRLADMADAAMEIDAWMLAATLVGFAVGDHAYQARTSQGPDTAWELW